jgi:hypothetical protein
MSSARPVRRTTPAGLLAALAVAADAADEVVLGTARDVHRAVARRAYAAVSRATAGSARWPQRVHDGVSGTVYAGLGVGLRGTARLLRAADTGGVGPRLDDSARGRFAVAAINGLIGDRLLDDGSPLAVELAVRVDGRDVPLDAGSLAGSFPMAGPDVAVFLHGLGEDETRWARRRQETGGSYGERLARETTWTPVFLRANTGLPIAVNASALAALLDDLVTGWPTPVRRIALVGHSMGGLVIRAACGVVTGAPTRWNTLVTNVVTLGSPHLGAPLERAVHAGAAVLGVLPESAPFGRILDYRSVGILDLRAGLAGDVRNLPQARYHLVAATLATSHRHPVSEVLGDLLVRYPSATGRPRRGPAMFPGADVLHVRGDHFDLLNHPDVHDALKRWLG